MWAQRWLGFLLVFSVSCEAPFLSPGATAGASGENELPAGGGKAGNGSGARSGAETRPGDSGGGGNAHGGSESGGGESGGGESGGGDVGGSASHVESCNELASAGVFEDITPPEVKAGLGEVSPTGDLRDGPFSLEVDPIHHGVYYVGTHHQGLWKTADCGSTWSAVATGKNADGINRGINWTLGIDHQTPSTLYTSSAYAMNGLFKSTDGGVSWTDVWSAVTQPELASAFEYGFVNQLVVDPRDSRHLLLTMHENCKPPHSTSCVLESEDAGDTWSLHEGDSSWEPDQGLTIQFLDGASTWLTGSQSNGVWRTSDAGETWSHLKDMATTAQQGIALVRTEDGTFYLGGSDGIWRSPDGALDSWVFVPDTGPFVSGLATDGKAVYASTCYAKSYCEQPRYLRSVDGQSWKPLPNVPPLTQGGLLRYDAGHRLLVSSNGSAGVWRVVVP